MADQTLVDILRQGADVWNKWRTDHIDVLDIDLRKANLHLADLHGASLKRADLRRASLRIADLRGADLRDANLSGASLSDAILRGANLRDAILRDADLIDANLHGANLSGADLSDANLSGADLSNADLSNADLTMANLSESILTNADLSGSRSLKTRFNDVDLSSVKGLSTVIHSGPSTVGIDTLYRSQGKIPEIFLRGCGVPENLITYFPSLVNKAIDFYSCFISYSHANKEFARRLHDRLQGEGIRCWLDEHQLNVGDPLHPTIYEAIRVYDKVLLCCSETALTSWWVEKEFSRAIRKEEDYKDTVLIPMNLDGYLFDPKCDGWVADELKQRLVADFTNWKDHDAFEGGVKAVMKALRTDGGNLPHPEPKMKPKR